MTTYRLNKGVNYGHSTRLPYDKCAYADRLSESTNPILYKLDPNQISSCNSCLSVFGPRAGHNGVGDSLAGNISSVAPAQAVVDVESILTNRNVIAGKCKDSKVNDINVNNFTLQHARICNDFLDPLATHLTNPPQNYRSMNINRFYNLHKPAQSNIFYDWQINSRLEAKDNYREHIPKLYSYDGCLPQEVRDKNVIMSQYDNKCPGGAQHIIPMT